MKILLSMLLLTTLTIAQGLISPDITWLDGKATLTLTATGITPQEGQESLPVQVRVLLQSDQSQLMEQTVNLPLTGENAGTIELPLSKIKEPKKLHIVEIEALDLYYRESLYVADAKGALASYGLRHTGRLPAEKVELVLHMRGIAKDELPNIPCQLALRDRTDTLIMSRQDELKPTRDTTRHALDITPDIATGIGPYSLEFSLEQEDLNIFASSQLRFGYANAEIPVTSFERPDFSTWIPDSDEDPFRLKDMSFYYSKHLWKMAPQTYPEIHWGAPAHTGQNALAITYDGIQPAHVYSRQELPGNPVSLSLWVKGNNSPDQLVIHFQDNINHTLQAWIRNPQFSRETICTLDFTGWRQFRVPVLSRGLAIPNSKGSTENIDGPLAILSFSIVPPRYRKGQEPAEPPPPLYIDAISVETQAEQAERLTMELTQSDLHGELTATGTLRVAVGNGTAESLPNARLALVARDRSGESVYNARQELTIEPNGWAEATFPLAELAAKKPRGPVTISLTMTVPGMPGLRTSRQVAYKSPHHTAVILDFEQQDVFSSFTLEGVGQAPWAKVVAGGTDGGQTLAIDWSPDRADNSVLFHPALPGEVSRVEVMVKGTGKPVTMQPWFIDSSLTGIWQLKYNLFWPEPIVIDWTGWQKIAIPAPPIPDWYGDRQHYFFRQPWYPLNLALNLLPGEGAPQQILLDDIRVITHLDPAAEVTMDIRFPDATRLHAPGQPLALSLTNFGPNTAKPTLTWRLTNYQGHVAAEGTTPTPLTGGESRIVTLVEALAAGIYQLDIEGIGDPMQASIQVVDAKHYFGPEPDVFLQQLPAVRKSVGQTREKFYMDWDNTEPVPNLFHYNWAEQEMATRSAEGAYQLTSIFGFSSDWAGPEAQEAIDNGTYARTFPNYLQVPVSTLNWSQFVRESMREFGKRFDQFVFWENPDLVDSPQGIPATRYRELLHELHRWARLYNPQAKVIAGGFNYNRILPYLEEVGDPHTLDFDGVAVQVNLGDLSPEAGELEAFLDELNALLKLRRLGRTMHPSELDWSIGEYVSPLQQAAYHARTSLILNSRGVGAHTFSVINTGYAFEGFGVVYRAEYGNSPEIQTFTPTHIPKPAYFALRQVQDFLKEWEFVSAINLPHQDLRAGRAFVYKNAKGRLATVVWSTTDDILTYTRPAAWKGATSTDMFAVPLVNQEQLEARPLPFITYLPAGYALTTLTHDLRHLSDSQGRWPVILDLHLADADSRKRADYTARGDVTSVEYSGRIPGSRKVREPFSSGLSEEAFAFDLTTTSHVLLTRRWYFDGEGNTLTVRLNDGPAMTWDLTVGKDEAPGIRESTWVLRDCPSGTNRLTIAYAQPGNCAGYRLAPLTGDSVPLSAWGPLHVRQTVGELERFRSAVGTPLRIGHTAYALGIGAHATSFIEYPIDGLFDSFEVTVGIDGYTEGRGSAAFKIYADGKEVANSGPMNGLSKPLTLNVEELAGVQRLILSVTNGGDGDQHDLANWVDGKLHLK